MSRRAAEQAASGDPPGDSCPRRFTNTPDRLRLFPASRGASGGLGIRRAHLRLFPRSALSRCPGNARRLGGGEWGRLLGLPRRGRGCVAARGGGPGRGRAGPDPAPAGLRKRGLGRAGRRGPRELGAASEVSARRRPPRTPWRPGRGPQGGTSPRRGRGGEVGGARSAPGTLRGGVGATKPPGCAAGPRSSARPAAATLRRLRRGGACWVAECPRRCLLPPPRGPGPRPPARPEAPSGAGRPWRPWSADRGGGGGVWIGTNRLEQTEFASFPPSLCICHILSCSRGPEFKERKCTSL